MNIGTMTILCDHIERVTPIRLDALPTLNLLLDDVDASGIMRQMVSLMDPEDLLNYFNEDVIREYLAKQDNKLSPREQYNREYDGE